MLTATDLAALVAVEASTLSESASVTRPVRVSDGAGGFTAGAPATVLNGVACAIVPLDPPVLARDEHGRMEEVTRVGIKVAVGTAVKPGDTVVIGARSFRLLGVPEGLAYQTALVCPAVEVV